MLTARFGLPETVIFCSRCVMSNQRPISAVEFEHHPNSKKQTLHFDAEGVCDACRYAEMKDTQVDWGQRERELIALCDKYRSRNGSYDCVVPGSGGKDSVYASHVLKTKYRMNPVTVTWAPHLYTDVGFRNFQGWLHVGGFDNFLFTPNGQTHRKLTQLAYRNLLHPFQPFILGQKNFAPKMAHTLNIPLVFYGENEAEYGNPIKDNSNAQREAKYYSMPKGSNRRIFIGGVPFDDLRAHGIVSGHVEPYMPTVPDGIEVHYLGYYLKWTPQECFYYAVEHTGFEPNTERTEGTYSKYNSIDDKTDGYHYWTTFIKFGLGRASYDASQEIRNHHIDREEGVALVRKFDGEFPRKYFAEFLKYLDMEEAEFFEIADSFRSPHLWSQVPGGWKLRHTVQNLGEGAHRYAAAS